MVGLVQYTHDVGLLHDQEFLTIELDLGPRPFAEQHAVAGVDVDRDPLAGFVAAAGAHRNHLALLGLFLGAVRDDDTALGLRFGVDALDHDAVVERAKFGLGHGSSLWFVWEPELGDRRGGASRALSNRARGVLNACPEYGQTGFLSSKGLRPW